MPPDQSSRYTLKVMPCLTPYSIGRADVVEVLLVRLLQLLAAMMQRALRQQVDDARADRRRPVDGSVAVDEAENLDAIGRALWTRRNRRSSCTARRSPSLTRAEATSMRSTLTVSSRRCAMVRFSSGIIEMPSACSPSRSVVSMTSIRRAFPLLIYSRESIALSL